MADVSALFEDSFQRAHQAAICIFLIERGRVWRKEVSKVGLEVGSSLEIWVKNVFLSFSYVLELRRIRNRNQIISD